RMAEETANITDEAERSAAIERIKAAPERDRQTVLNAGGLFVLGTERHESRRIDNQLRGRSGRHGDPGRSKFFLSLEDDLLRIFRSAKPDGMLTNLGLKEGEAVLHPPLHQAPDKAPAKVQA